MGAWVTIHETSLRSLEWNVIEAQKLDGSPAFYVEGTLPGGKHVFFLSIPVDEVIKYEEGPGNEH